ncbi:MAG TPA: ABC transporter permease [Candidatus Sulfotelmatobacter sp.]|nr:ABC transporter permease [Candidatus Sulfotelmatobacter sp.]
MTGLAQDIRYALRQMHKSPGFAAVTVLTLTLGIGANTAIFSVVNAVLLNPLPFRNANRIVSLFQETQNFAKGSISYPNFLDWQRENRSFEGMAAYRHTDGGITGVGEPENVQAEGVSANFFPILGVNPILGRNFTSEEDQRSASPTALISEGLWKRKFGSDRNVIGQRLIVAGQPRTIIGVIPASFQLHVFNFRTADVYEPIGQETDPSFYLRDSYRGTDAVGLLKPGVTLAQARDDMKRVNAGLAEAYPDIDGNLKTNIMSLKENIVGGMGPAVLVLLGAVGFVLLIACVNVANLLLARSTARQQEFSVRAALGAGQLRILRQLLSESILLSALGGGFGLMLAKWGTAVALAAVPDTVPRAEEIGLHLPVLLFTVFVSVLTGIMFGLLPALRMSRTDISGRLSDSGRAISGPRTRMQSALVIGEMAMALVLLVGAGLMCRTLVQLWKVDPGFDPRNVSYFDVTPSPSLVKQSPDAIRAAVRQIKATIQNVDGVESASLNAGANPMQWDNVWPFLLEGQALPTQKTDSAPQTLAYAVEPEYLETMRIPLVRGRFLSDQDNEQAVRVAVIDTNFAQKYFAGQDPIGKHIRVFQFDRDSNQRVEMPLTIVGVVGHVNQWGLADDANQPLQVQMYRAVMQGSAVQMQNLAQGFGVFVRSKTPVESGAFFKAIRQKLHASNPDLIVSGNERETEVVADSIASQRFSVALLGAFAALALLLASIGIYGVLSYLVGQRTREIGIRMALGARRLDVLRMVLRDGARMTLAGTAIGIVAALGLTRLMASMLFGVKPTDPITFGLVAVVLCAVALLAGYVPARRAAKVDPMVALRYE